MSLRLVFWDLRACVKISTYKSVKVINDLLEAPPAETDTPPVWTESYNVWSLIQNPNQDKFETPTPPLTQDFDSGFLGVTLDTLGEFSRSFGEPEQGGIADEIFGVLDERSQRDSTVLIVKWELYVTEEYFQPGYTAEDDGLREGWQFIRHKFCGAATFISNLNFNDINAHLSDPASLDEHGVYREYTVKNDGSLVRST